MERVPGITRPGVPASETSCGTVGDLRCTTRPGQRADQAPELPACPGVEAGGRLVQEQQLRVADDADRDIESTPLAAGERAHPCARLLAQPDGIDHLIGVPGVGVVPGEVPNRFADGELGQVGDVL